MGADEALYGGAGADRREGRGGDDLLQGGAGADVLIGGGGIDTVDYSADAGAISIDLQTGASNGGDAEGDRFDGVERFIGTGFADALEIGRASWRERVCQYVEISVVAVSLKKTKQ